MTNLHINRYEQTDEQKYFKNAKNSREHALDSTHK